MLQLGGGKAKGSREVEIRLDSPFVVFHGDVHEADAVELTGSVHLSSSDYMSVRSVKIKLQGMWKVSWHPEAGTTPLQVKESGTHLEQEISLSPAEGVSHVTHKIAPGNHEWRFKFTLDPSLPESVEGLAGNYIVYELKAEIDRGYLSKALYTEKHVRVVRTLGRDIGESVPLPFLNEDTWKDKLWYHINIPTRYYIFGTSITAEFILCPLTKGVEIGKIKMEIQERVQLKADGGRSREFSKDIIVASHEQMMPECNMLPERVEELTGIPDESRHFRVTLPLPKNLKKMRQSVDTEHIKIFHNLKIHVNLHNPDGHVSQLLVRNLLQVFLSPNLAVGEDQTILASESQMVAEQNSNQNIHLEAPPTYGLHQLDRLYDDIDPTAFMSGANSPHTLLSRSNSDEHITSNLLDQTAISNTPSNARTPAFQEYDSSSSSALQLQNRLAELQVRQENDNDYTHPSPRVSPSHTVRPRALSFRGSFSQMPQVSSSESPIITYETFPTASAHGHLMNEEYDMEALGRTPSYATAVRTPVHTPPTGYLGLPSYEIAISTPNSPLHLPMQHPQAPVRAHLFNGSRRGSNVTISEEHLGLAMRHGSVSGSSDSDSLRNFQLNGSSRRGSFATLEVIRPVQAVRAAQ